MAITLALRDDPIANIARTTNALLAINSYNLPITTITKLNQPLVELDYSNQPLVVITVGVFPDLAEDLLLTGNGDFLTAGNGVILTW